MADENKSEGQSGSREPNRSHSAAPLDVKKHFQDKLAAESGGAPEPDNSGEPESSEGAEKEQTPGNQNGGDEGAKDTDNSSVDGEPNLDPKITVELVDADNKIIGYADDDGNEYDLKGLGIKPGKSDIKDGEHESADKVVELVVDDRRYSPEDIRALNKKDLERDADYRRKTTVMARLRKEYEVSGQDLEVAGSYFANLSSANVKQLEALDTSKMEPEEFQDWRNRLTAAKNGQSQMENHVTGLMTKVNEARDNMKNNEASESVEIMKSIETRWDDTFYQKLRTYAVDSQRYDAKEFANISDWRTMEGLISLMDRDEVTKISSGKNSTESTNIQRSPRSRRRQRRVNRNPGVNVSADKQKVFESTNAKRDGSFRQSLISNLQNERR